MLQGIGHPRAGCGVAIPAIVGHTETLAGFEVALAKHGLLAQHRPLPAASGQRLLQPALLHRAQQRAPRVGQSSTTGGVDRAGTRATALGAGVRVAVLAVVQQVQGGQAAKWHAVVQAQLAVGAPDTIQRPAQRRSAQRHVFVIGLVGGGTAGGEVNALGPATALGAAGVVVLHFVVVPGQQPGAGCVHALQMGVTFVQGVAGAVVVQRDGGRSGHSAYGFAAATVFVDVVAQKHQGVELLALHVAVGAVVAMFPVLTRGIAQAQPLGRSARCRESARAAHRANCSPEHEAVVVPAVGLQALQLHVHRMRQRWQSLRLPGLHSALELRIVRHFPTHRDRPE